MGASERRMVFARIEPEFRRRVKAEADRRYQGNESMVVRAALEMYLDLREELGPRFEIVVDAFRQNGKVAA